MPTLVDVHGYEEFRNFIDNFNVKDAVLYLYFTGDKNPDGVSWCPDCNDASPVLAKFVKNLPENLHIVTVYVGDRPIWKDSKNPFRTDSQLKLMQIPTLLKWKGIQKLVTDQVAKEELLELMFADEED